ncbi:unnamed protein product [Discula destructiva]
MVTLQIMSDLHLESPKSYHLFEIEPKAPYLALLGDIGNIEKHRSDCLAFLKKLVKQFDTVLFVPGNHEAYHSSWTATLAILKTYEEVIQKDSSLSGEFILLDRTTYLVPDTTFAVVGCSLFSAVPSTSAMDVEMGLNDFFQTADWNITRHNDAHERDLAWLNTEVDKLGVDKIVIVSHWSPSRDARAMQLQHAGSRITAGFSTDLSHEPCYINPKVKIWAFGHTHYNCDFMVERESGHALRLLANQRGYYFAQADGFDGTKTVEV